MFPYYLICSSEYFQVNNFQFLHGEEFKLPTNTFEIDHRIEEIKKVKTKHIGLKDKYMHLRWIFGIVATAQDGLWDLPHRSQRLV